MFAFVAAILPGCVAPDAPPDAVAPADDTADATVDDRWFAVDGTVGEGGVVTCHTPEGREVRPLFDPPDPGDLPTTQTAAAEDKPGGWGVTVADLDGDGVVDLFLPHRDGAQLFRGDGAGGFDLVHDALPASDGGVATGSSAADYDGDGDLDLLLARQGPDALWRNDGGRFTDVTETAGIGAEPYYSIGGSWADWDGDGDLDLFVATEFTDALHPEDATEDEWEGDRNLLWENLGDGTFGDRSGLLEVSRDAVAGFTHIGGWWDVDGDLRPELHIVNDKGRLGFADALLGYADGAFVDLSPGSGIDLSIQGMGLGAADLNGDGVPDFLVADWGHVWLLVSDGAGGWYDASIASGLQLPLDDDRFVAWGAELADLDDDGDDDAVVAFGPDDLYELVVSEEGVPSPFDQPDGLWLQEDGTFVQRAEAWEFDDRAVKRGFALADLDGNGWLDFVRRDLQGKAWVQLQGCGEAGWLEVALAGPAPNTYGVGARVEVEAGGRRWTRWIHSGSTNVASSAPLEAHFGLGDLDTVDVLRVRWPDGGTQEFTDLAARQRVRVTRE